MSQSRTGDHANFMQSLLRPLVAEADASIGSPMPATQESASSVIETESEPTLEQMLAAFDLNRHGGEAMADSVRGAEAPSHGDAQVSPVVS